MIGKQAEKNWMHMIQEIIKLKVKKKLALQRAHMQIQNKDQLAD